MSDMMMFPNTVEEFMEQYKIVDTEKIYTNGADLVPIFRMMQWFEHVSATDTISRQAAIDELVKMLSDCFYADEEVLDAVKTTLKELPPAQPEQRTGKWIHISQAPDLVKGYWAKCSACGRGSFGGGRFCRECGTKMKGANNDT